MGNGRSKAKMSLEAGDGGEKKGKTKKSGVGNGAVEMETVVVEDPVQESEADVASGQEGASGGCPAPEDGAMTAGSDVTRGEEEDVQDADLESGVALAGESGSEIPTGSFVTLNLTFYTVVSLSSLSPSLSLSLSLSLLPSPPFLSLVPTEMPVWYRHRCSVVLNWGLSTWPRVKHSSDVDISLPVCGLQV